MFRHPNRLSGLDLSVDGNWGLIKMDRESYHDDLVLLRFIFIVFLILLQCVDVRSAISHFAKEFICI